MDFLIAIEVRVGEPWLQTKEGAFFASQDTMGSIENSIIRSRVF